MFLGVAGVCKTRINKPFSLLWLATCCPILHSQWCQGGVNWCRFLRLGALFLIPLQGRSALASAVLLVLGEEQNFRSLSRFYVGVIGPRITRSIADGTLLIPVRSAVLPNLKSPSRVTIGTSKLPGFGLITHAARVPVLLDNRYNCG